MRNHRSVLRAHAASRAVYALEQQVCLSSLSAFVVASKTLFQTGHSAVPNIWLRLGVKV